MGIIGKISLNLSTKLGNRLNKDYEEIEVLNYGLFMIIHTIAGMILTVLVGIITGLTMEIVIITITGALFKRYTGGAHASTPERCLIIGIILSLFLSILTKFMVSIMNINTIGILSTIILVYSYYTLYKRCPVPSKNKPLKKESIRKKLRKKAINLIKIYISMIVILYFSSIIFNIDIFKTIIVSCLLGILFQTISLTEIGLNFIKVLDNSFNIFKLN